MLLTIIRTSLTLMLICGLAYPVIMTGVDQMIAPAKANGSLIYNQNHQVIGSALIGQQFTSLKYFQGRVSSIHYDAAGSGSPNYAPSNPDLKKRVQTDLEKWKKNNPDVPVSHVPLDLITNSGSGLDPDISPAAAYAQVPRISKLTGITPSLLNKLIQSHITGRDLGIFGEPRVNVLDLNLALSKKLKS